MSATAQHLLGQLADGRFPLRKLLGVSANSAVFLTSLAPARPGDPSPDAAIKLVPEDPASSDLQLDHWRAAAGLSHPGILRILHHGRCNIDGSPCLYIVTELADEDLGQLLPTRALTPDETRGMLAPVLSALDFLHENGLVHAGLKPSNIHAIGDNVKLSADRILPEGESLPSWPLAAPYAAPDPILFPASDLWSLGMSLCETLSKTVPVRETSGQFMLPDLPAPFSEIVRAALVEDATLRITLDQTRSLLDPTFVPRRKPDAAAIPVSTPNVATSHVPVASPDSPEALIAAVHADGAQAAGPAASSSRNASRQPLPQIDPLAVQLSSISPPSRSRANAPPRTRIPVSSLPQVNATIGGPRRVATLPASRRFNKLVLVSSAAAILLAVVFVPRFFLRSAKSSAPISASAGAASAISENSAATKSPRSSSARSLNSAPTSTPSASKSGAATPTKDSAAVASATASPNATSRASSTNSATLGSPSASHPAPAASSSATSAAHPAASNVNPLAPTILRKVLPVVSEKARSTINGTVRINVRVQLNPDGTVSSAELANPAGSQFFADLALKAAQQWQFGPSSSDTSSTVPSSAVIRFDFTQTATSAYLP